MEGAAKGQAHLLAGRDGGGRSAGHVVEGGAAGRPRGAWGVTIASHIVDLTGQGGHILHQRLAQPAAGGREGGSLRAPPGLAPSGGDAGDRSRRGGGGGRPHQEAATGEGRGTERPALAAAEGQDQAGSLGERWAEIPQAPATSSLLWPLRPHGPCPTGHTGGVTNKGQGQAGPGRPGTSPQDSRAKSQALAPAETPCPLCPKEGKAGGPLGTSSLPPVAHKDPRLEPHLCPRPGHCARRCSSPPSRRRVGGHCPPSFPSLPVEGL